MATKKDTFYVTTPIYYATAKPHLGSLYSTLLADVVARWNTLYGKDVFFLTGTDEHGQKIAQAAERVGKSPKEFLDDFIPSFKQVWKDYGIDYNQFIRTTDAYHIAGAQAFIKTLIEKGEVYKAAYEGWYCTPCETFVTGQDDYKKDQGPPCPSCQRTTVVVSEETYFFKLSAYQDRLLKLYKENPDFIAPRERLNEVISFVSSGLKDLSISRTTVAWGVPFPDDPKHTVYVWVEALCNYITALGYGQSNKPSRSDSDLITKLNEKDINFLYPFQIKKLGSSQQPSLSLLSEEFEKWWPANLHIIGKDIVRFHAVYWPAMLMAAQLPLPKRLLVHGWIKVDKQKMSKSLGNVVDPMVLCDRYGAEPVRYYLLRQMPINQDGDFSVTDVEQRIESDLANDLGNLLNRMVSLAQQYNVHEVPAPHVWSKQALTLRSDCRNTVEDFENYMTDYMFHMALARLWKFINQVNAYFHGQEPWKLAKKDKEQFMQVLSSTCHGLYAIALLLWSVMPKKMEQLLASIGIKNFCEGSIIVCLKKEEWNKKFMLKKIPALFEKPVTVEEMKEEIEKKQNGESAYISIDDLTKLELRVGTITRCEEIPDSTKLLKLAVDFGIFGQRQILSGIKKWYQPNDLVGKQAVFIVNLKPRKMLGVTSQGMLFIAEDENGKPQIVTVAASVPNGSQLR